jgi:hypothetical protein
VIRSSLRAPFNLAELKTGDTPRYLSQWDFPVDRGIRVNHWMLKTANNNATDVFAHINPFGGGVIRFVERSLNHLLQRGCADLYIGRYLYLTIDTKPVPMGEAQRVPGWHLDGMQGDEVPDKVAPDIAFVWCDGLPPRFLSGGIDVTDLNPSEDNIFKAMDDRIDGTERRQDTFALSSYGLYLIHAYMPHTGVIATEDTPYRTFLRLSCSLTPITSQRMTINPKIRYDYPTHTTSGEIPARLKSPRGP